MISSQETRKEKFMGKEIVGLPKSRHTNFSSKFSTFQHPHLNVKNKRLSFYFIFKEFQIAFFALFLQFAIPFSTSVSLRPWGRQSRFIFYPRWPPAFGCSKFQTFMILFLVGLNQETYYRKPELRQAHM